MERERGAVADVGERARVRDIAATDLRSGARDIEHAYYGGPGEQMPSSVGPLPPFPLVAPTRPNRNTRGNGRAGREFFEFAPREPAKGKERKGKGEGDLHFLLEERRDFRMGFVELLLSLALGRVDFFFKGKFARGEISVYRCRL